MTENFSLADARVRWDDKRSRARQIKGDFHLAPTSAGSTVGDAAMVVAAAAPGSAEKNVKAFLVENGAQIGMELGPPDLECIQDLRTPTGRVVRYRELRDGLPVHGTEVVVRLGERENVCQIDLAHEADSPIVEAVGDGPGLTPDEAIRLALEVVGEYSHRGEPPRSEKLFFPTAEGLKPAYRVVILTREPMHDWQLMIDSRSGEVLDREDLIVRMPDGEGLVFDPNPVVTANDNTLRDPDAGNGCDFAGSPLADIDAQRVTRTLRDLKQVNGGHRLEGPFVKIVNFQPPSIAPPVESDPKDFKYSSADPRFEAVNVYYHIDTVQRHIQSLGITTAHAGRIEADVHAGGNGAFFSAAEGRLRFGNSGNCQPNRASDGDVALHEYGHAIHHDQVPGWGAPNPVTDRKETKAMGEGFGDVLACVFFAEHGGGFQREFFEDWIFAHQGALRRLGSAKVYPFDIPSGAGGDWVDQEHADGEIWSAALWSIYRAIGGDDGDQAVRRAAADELLKTLILSHHRLSASATMPEGAEAFMEESAELTELRLRNGIEILRSFHNRGLLHCESGSDLRITELWSQQDDLSVRGAEDVEQGRDNWFFATVRNQGTRAARALTVSFSFKHPRGNPAVPADFRHGVISSAVEFDLAVGATATVKARWPQDLIPAIPNGEVKLPGCLLVEVSNPADAVAAGVASVAASGGKLARHDADVVI